MHPTHMRIKCILGAELLWTITTFILIIGEMYTFYMVQNISLK